MPFVALIYGVPITIVFLLIGICSYSIGLKCLKAKNTISSKNEAVAILTLSTMPLNILGALYFAGVIKFFYIFISSGEIHSVKDIPISGIFSFLAGTLNVMSPIKISGGDGPTINTIYETTIIFFVLLIYNLKNAKYVYLNMLNTK